MGILKVPFSQFYFKLTKKCRPIKGIFNVSNTKYYGGKYIISSDAAIDDGKLDICLIKSKGLFNIIICGFQMAFGKQLKS